jgi:hypothetical protein
MDDRLRDDYRRAMSAPSTPHLSDETWEALALGELSALDRERALEHIIACDLCSTTYRVVQDVERGASELGAPVRLRARAGQPSNTKWYALAATIAVVVIGATTYRMMVPPPPPQSASAPVASPAPAPSGRERVAIPKAEVRLAAERSLRTRGSGDEDRFVEDFAAAIAPYREDRFAEAAAALAALTTKYPDAFEPAFYHGVSLLLSDNPTAAIAPLERAHKRAPAAMRDEVLRYLALARDLTRQR